MDKTCEMCGKETGQYGHRGCQRELEVAMNEKGRKIKRAIEEHIADGAAMIEEVYMQLSGAWWVVVLNLSTELPWYRLSFN